MAIRTYKPTSPARRFMSVLTYEEITKKSPEKSLVEYLKKNAGRNKQGKITVRHQGGGNKIKYRVIDFKRNKLEIPAKVAAIEYDPNRSAFIALLFYADGEKRYILAPLGLKDGDKVMTGMEIGIENNSDEALKEWTLELEIDQLKSCDGWNGNFKVKGNKLTVTNVDYNGEIAKGGSTSIGCNIGTGTKLNVKSAKLNGVECTVKKGKVSQNNNNNNDDYNGYYGNGLGGYDYGYGF